MSDPIVRDSYAAPLPDDAPAPVRGQPRARRALSPELAIGILGGLVLLTVLVVFALPAWIASRTPMKAPAVDNVSAVQEPPTPDEPTGLLPEPPGAREAAQEALVALMEALDALRAQRVAEWDAEGLAKLEALQASGEESYRAQRYTAAQRDYQTAQKRLAEISGRLPRIISELVEEGERALRSGEAAAAEQAFTRALGLAPDNTEALQGQQRARNWERVVALLNEARGHERMGESAKAEAIWRSALALDPQAGEATQGLARLAQARASEAFAKRMSDGYAALEKNDFRTAETAFQAAAKLRPAAPEARNALEQTGARATAYRLERALSAAAQATRAEDWANAARHFDAALTLDTTLPAARDGATAARRRAALDKRLEASLGATARLADASVQREVEALLREARAVTPAGPRLQQQTARLQAALTAARTQVRVALVSDGATEVTLLGAGGLGRFTRREIPLTPGRYTALGSRPGYRDARVEFTVDSAGPAPRIEIQCLEALPFGR